MTVQTEAKPVFGTAHRTTIRGLKGFVIGFAALVAAGAGIGWAVSSSSDAPADVIAPVTQLNPSSEQRDALKRLQDGSSGASAEKPDVVWYLPGKPGIK